MSLYSTIILPIAEVTQASNASDGTSALIQIVVALIGSNIASSWFTYWVSSKKATKKATQELMDGMYKSNAEFQKQQLKEAQMRWEEQTKINEELRTQIKNKSRELIEIQSTIADLKNQLSIRETSISELNTQILTREVTIATLKDEVEKLKKVTKLDEETDKQE
jgi:signal recognition particle GTPase